MNNDLNIFSKHFDFTLQNKKSESDEDAKLRRFKDKCLFIATLIAIATLFSVCIWVIIFAEDSPKSTLAMNGLIALTTALAAYYVRGKN